MKNKIHKLRQLLLITLLILFSSVNNVLAEGTYMLPRAMDLYNSGEYREAYNLAYRIGADNPQCWQAYEIKALSALALNNPGEALANINKAISTKHTTWSNDLSDEVDRLHVEHSIISFKLAYEMDTTNINPQYERSILNDLELLVFNVDRYRLTNGYLIYFLHYISNTACPIERKIRLLVKMLSLSLNKGISTKDIFTIYGTALKIVNNADETTLSNIGKSKKSMLLYIKNTLKLPQSFDRENASEISLYNDLVDMFYFLMTDDITNYNYVYNGIKNNSENGLYCANNIDETIDYVRNTVECIISPNKIRIERDAGNSSTQGGREYLKKKYPEYYKEKYGNRE